MVVVLVLLKHFEAEELLLDLPALVADLVHWSAVLNVGFGGFNFVHAHRLRVHVIRNHHDCPHENFFGLVVEVL